jgi:diketogulonate reductase-like aldo/keto reductase
MPYFGYGCSLTIRSLYGDSEELIGKWLKRTGKRNEIFIATKFGFLKDASFGKFDSSAVYCQQACEASLKALDIDYIDLCKLQSQLSGFRYSRPSKSLSTTSSPIDHNWVNHRFFVGSTNRRFH